MSSAKAAAKIPPKPGKDVIYLDIDDDITTIVDKVSESKDKITALVLPKRFATLQSIVNMRLLKRSADSAAKNVVLITSEAALLPLAGAAGIHVAKNLQSKPEVPPSPVDLPQEKPAVPEDPDAEINAVNAKLDYHRSIGELASASIVEEPETIPLEDAEDEEKTTAHAKGASRDKKLKVPNFERFRLLLVLGGVGVVAFITFLIFAIFVWPKAVITLQTEATPLSAVFELTTSTKATALDEEKGIIPAVLESSTLSSDQKVQATGEQNNGKKAKGSITMTGKACAPNLGNIPTDVPAGTGVSSGGLYFITQEKAKFSFDYPDVSCNYYKTNSVAIVAQAGGTKYNISDSSFTVTNRSDVNATGSASGGTDDIETVLSQADVNGAANKITDEDRNKFVDSFKKKLDEDGFYLIEATLKAKDPAVTASPAVGQAASDADVSIKIAYSVLVVFKEDLKKAITDELNKQIDPKKQKIGSDDVLQDVTVTVQSQKSSTVVTLNVNADTTAVPTIDTDSIKKQVGGKKAGEIQRLLGELPGVKSVEVEMSPFWVSKAPKASKVTIIQQQVKTEPSGS